MNSDLLKNDFLISGMGSIYSSIFSDSLFSVKVEKGSTQDPLKLKLLRFYQEAILTRSDIDIEDVCGSIIIKMEQWSKFSDIVSFTSLKEEIQKETDNLIIDYRTRHPLI